MKSSSANVDVEALNPFLVLTFADLKKYRYYYWCGFPALLQKPGWETEGVWNTLEDGLSQEQVSSARAAVGRSANRLRCTDLCR